MVAEQAADLVFGPHDLQMVRWGTFRLTVRSDSGRGGIRRVRGQLGRDWQAGLRHLPFVTQRTAVLVLGGVVTLVGWPGARTPEAGDRSGADAGGAAMATSPPTTTQPGSLGPVDDLPRRAGASHPGRDRLLA
jgi:hypothetical protein